MSRAAEQLTPLPSPTPRLRRGAHPSRRRRVVPGFGLSLGYTVSYLSLVVLIPLSALLAKSATMGWRHFWDTVLSDGVMSAYSVTFIDSAAAASVNLVLGLLVAWVLARYTFPGRRVMDALVDLPFMLPTAVAGITLCVLYSDHGWVGMLLSKAGFHYYWPAWRGFHAGRWPWWPFGYESYDRVSFAPLGVVVALTFIGMPFVIRTVQPVLEDLSREMEEAAASLGASRFQNFPPGDPAAVGAGPADRLRPSRSPADWESTGRSCSSAATSRIPKSLRCGSWPGWRSTTMPARPPLPWCCW